MLWNGPSEPDESIILLSRCKFGTDCDMTIKLPRLAPRQVHFIRPLFVSNTFRICVPRLPSLALSLLMPEIMWSEQVDFIDHFPPPDAWTVPCFPRVIRLQSNLAEEQLDFWNFIAALPRRLPQMQLHEGLTIEIYNQKINANDSRFSWKAGSNLGIAQTIGRLLAVAISLHKKGVSLLDEDGCDVRSFFD
jgi:hypothetical protein